VTLVSAQLKLDVTIPAEGGIELGAWLFLPKGDGIRPAITMAHGFGGTREHGLELRHSARRGSSCLCTIIAISG